MNQVISVRIVQNLQSLECRISWNFCLVLLTNSDPQPGGDYTYILDSLGPFIGFVRLWAECLIVRPCTITIVALTFAKYSVKLLFPECDPPDDSVRMLAAVCICVLAFINCWNVKVCPASNVNQKLKA